MTWLTKKIEEILAERREERIIRKYGWIGRCPHCQEWSLPEDAKSFSDDGDHWNFECSCGGFSQWGLHAPIPVLVSPFNPNGLASAQRETGSP